MGKQIPASRSQKLRHAALGLRPGKGGPNWRRWKHPDLLTGKGRPARKPKKKK